MFRPFRTRVILFVVIATIRTSMVCADTANFSNPTAVEKILSGSRETAKASWWGFDEEDSTEFLQAAINSGAHKVVIPNLSKPWIVRPIQLKGDQELVLEEGVVVEAKRGEFRERGDSLFTAKDIDNLTIRGYGATLKMQKEDYMVGDVLHRLGWNRWFGQYEKAEWRMALRIRGCKNVQVLGLTLSDSGGDGIYIADGKDRKISENIAIRDVVCDNNYRQGISIIGVKNLLVEDSVFKNTWGTPPSAGVDIEPDGEDDVVQGVVFRNCRFEDNYGDGIEVALRNLKGEVSILFEDCHVTSSRGSGIRVTKIGDAGADGLIEFRNCTVENTVAYGIKVQDKSKDRARVRFVDCTLRNVSQNKAFSGACAPIWFESIHPKQTQTFGGIDFENLLIEDDHDRPWLIFQKEEDHALHDVKGTVRVRNPKGVEMQLGDDLSEVNLEVDSIQ
ncbi:MAG: right-handed parallel beta-helix repeat-containing protein [Candidatus Omnitrophica bacterium]|nr:right-handed parallel beta-helix repeat-containing protein [Candidatus Omnitrophota bacterium]